MRRISLSIPRSILTLSGTVAWAAACSLAPTGPATSSAAPDPASASAPPASVSTSATRVLTLVGDGTALHLKGAPADSSYAATYPIKGYTAMTVTASAYGDLTATCAKASGAAACESLPFFTQVKDGSANVYDPYAKVVLTLPAPPSLGGSDGGAAPTPPTPPAAPGTGTGTGTGAGPSVDAGSGAGSSGGAASCVPSVSASISACSLTVGGMTCECSDPTCAANAIQSCIGSVGSSIPGLGDAGLTGFPFDDSGIPGLGALDDAGIPGLGSGSGAAGDAGSGACSASAVDAAKSQFCAGVDAWLTAHNVNATLDCNAIGTLTFPTTLPPASTSGFTCDQITQDAFAQVRSSLATCNPLDYIGWDSSAELQLFDDGVCTIW